MAAKLGIFTLWSFAVVSQLRNFFLLLFFIFYFGFRNCEMRFTVLRNPCAKKWFRSCENFRREGPEAAKWFRRKMAIPQRSGDSAANLLGLRNGFAAKGRFCRGCEISQTPVFPLFLHFSYSKRLSFISFTIPPDFDHPKTYITSKQIRIKALKSKLNH